MKILVTGSSGYVGSHLCAELAKHHEVIEQDLVVDVLHDITRPEWLHLMLDIEPPDLIYHLAANKYAIAGEEYPAKVARTNIDGTANVVLISQIWGVPLIFASTCKAADPMTAYGASKLIAERIVRNAGKHVFRFVNILDSTGSVLQIWREVPEDQPIYVTDCKRMWMTTEEAVNSLIEVAKLAPGTYGPFAPPPSEVVHLAEELYPDRDIRYQELRLGDRPVERLVAEYEDSERISPNLVRITGLW